MADRRYLSCADTAKLVRKALREKFPGVTFSVRSSVYSLGASIRVGWTDGPRRAVVDPVVQRFSGATFDGMIDLKSYHDSELDGERVHFGADFIFCHREVSDFDAMVTAAGAYIREHCDYHHGLSPSGDQFGTQYISDLARGMAWDSDPSDADPLRGAFRRVVLRDQEAA
jgi:hypothetical protein